MEDMGDAKVACRHWCGGIMVKVERSSQFGWRRAISDKIPIRRLDLYRRCEVSGVSAKTRRVAHPDGYRVRYQQGCPGSLILQKD